MNNNVIHPSHYTKGKIECIDAIEAATTGLDGFEAFCTGNALKYLWRWKNKNGREDLKKAIWYIEHLLEYLSTASFTTKDIMMELEKFENKINIYQ